MLGWKGQLPPIHTIMTRVQQNSGAIYCDVTCRKSCQALASSKQTSAVRSLITQRLAWFKNADPAHMCNTQCKQLGGLKIVLGRDYLVIYCSSAATLEVHVSFKAGKTTYGRSKNRWLESIKAAADVMALLLFSLLGATHLLQTAVQSFSIQNSCCKGLRCPPNCRNRSLGTGLLHMEGLLEPQP